MPLNGENYKRDNKLVYSMLKAACVSRMPGLGSRIMISLVTGERHGSPWLIITTEQVSSTSGWKGQRKRLVACIIGTKVFSHLNGM